MFKTTTLRWTAFLMAGFLVAVEICGSTSPPTDRPAAETAAETTIEGAGSSELEAAPGASTQAVDSSRSGLIAKMWWNQPAKIEALALSPEQRSRMDAALQAFFDAGRARRGAQKKPLVALGEALEQGDFETARIHGDALAEATAAPVRAQAEMMVEVVALLTPDQRRELAAKFPRMLSSLWLRSASPGALGLKSSRRGASR